MEYPKRKFKFYMTDDDLDEEYLGEWTVSYYPSVQEELDFLLEQFKRFLAMCGWSENALSHLQYLEDEEWKYVLTEYGEWGADKQGVYDAKKDVLDKIKNKL